MCILFFIFSGKFLELPFFSLINYKHLCGHVCLSLLGILLAYGLPVLLFFAMYPFFSGIKRSICTLLDSLSALPVFYFPFLFSGKLLIATADTTAAAVAAWLSH